MAVKIFHFSQISQNQEVTVCHHVWYKYSCHGQHWLEPSHYVFTGSALLLKGCVLAQKVNWFVTKVGDINPGRNTRSHTVTSASKASVLPRHVVLCWSDHKQRDPFQFSILHGLINGELVELQYKGKILALLGVWRTKVADSLQKVWWEPSKTSSKVLWHAAMATIYTFCVDRDFPLSSTV